MVVCYCLIEGGRLGETRITVRDQGETGKDQERSGRLGKARRDHGERETPVQTKNITIGRK